MTVSTVECDLSVPMPKINVPAHARIKDMFVLNAAKATFTVESDPGPLVERRVYRLQDGDEVPKEAEYIVTFEYLRLTRWHFYVGRDEQPTQQ